MATATRTPSYASYATIMATFVGSLGAAVSVELQPFNGFLRAGFSALTAMANQPEEQS